jgi:hypothetical protein
MGAPVLTKADTFQCQHGGTATLTIPPTRTLSVGGNPVVVQSDLATAVITGCGLTQVPAPPCVSIISTLAGTSTVLKADGSPVLVAGAQGATNAGTWSVLTPGSSQLEA